MLLAASLAPTTLAVDTSTLRDIGPVDAGTCRAINAELRAHPGSVSASARSAIPGLKDSDCRLLVEVEGHFAIGLGPEAVAAATSCSYVYKQLHIYSGPIETYTAHIDAYDCWNGNVAWQQDFLHCHVTAYPLGFGGSDWCGTINNYTATVTLRNDFYVATYALPTWHRPGWMSYTVSRTGGISEVSGFCCS